jgi:hypothetical protein
MARATARSFRNGPSKPRRRRALTSALNNPAAIPDMLDATSQVPSGEASSSTTEAARTVKDELSSQPTSQPLVSGPIAPETVPSRHDSRKRKRIFKEEEDDDEQPSVPDPVHVESLSNPMEAGPSSYASRPGALLANIGASTFNAAEHHRSATTQTTQQQLQDRSRLLAAQEGKAKLEARVETLGKEVAFKNDVRILRIREQPRN